MEWRYQRVNKEMFSYKPDEDDNNLTGPSSPDKGTYASVITSPDSKQSQSRTSRSSMQDVDWREKTSLPHLHPRSLSGPWGLQTTANQAGTPTHQLKSPHQLGNPFITVTSNKKSRTSRSEHSALKSEQGLPDTVLCKYRHTAETNYMPLLEGLFLRHETRTSEVKNIDGWKAYNLDGDGSYEIFNKLIAKLQLDNTMVLASVHVDTPKQLQDNPKIGGFSVICPCKDAPSAVLSNNLSNAVLKFTHLTINKSQKN